MEPPDYQKLLDILTDDEDIDGFIKAFHALVSEKIKQEVLFYDFYGLYLHAKENLDGDQFSQHFAKYTKIIQVNCREQLFKAAQSHDHILFARYFATVPIGERVGLLTEDNHALYLELPKNLKPEEVGTILCQLPPNMTNPEDPFQRRLAQARHAYEEGDYALVSQFLVPFFHEKEIFPVSESQPLEDDLNAQLSQCVDSNNFEKFIKCFNQIPVQERIIYLAENDAFLYKKAYARFNDSQILCLMALLPREIATTDIAAITNLLLQTRDNYKNNINRAQLILGQLFIRASAETIQQPQIKQLSAFMKADDFVQFIKSQAPSTLASFYFSDANPSNNPLLTVLLSQGPEPLNILLEVLAVNYSAQLLKEFTKKIVRSGVTNYLYEFLLNYPGNHRARVVSSIANSLADEIRISLLHRYLLNNNPLPWESVLILLRGMSPRTRLDFLLRNLADPAQTIAIEAIGRMSPKSLLETLALFTDPTAHFLIFTYPMKYKVTRRYANNNLVNSAVETASSLVSWIPAVGGYVKKEIEGYQGQVDITEYLLSHMLREIPNTQQQLLGLLSELSSIQLTELLRAPDAQERNILMCVMTVLKREELLTLLARCMYAVPNDKRMIIPETYVIPQFREEARGHKEGPALVGFLAFLCLYNYMAVRGLESNDQTYQGKKEEYIAMLKCLEASRTHSGIEARLREHCRANSLTRAYVTPNIPMVTSAYKLGTNRHADARDKLLDLKSSELQQGLLMFEEFIALRVSQFSTPSALDRSIHSVMRSPQTKDFSQKMTSM